VCFLSLSEKVGFICVLFGLLEKKIEEDIKQLSVNHFSLLLISKKDENDFVT
jgi:hypothetical protein